MGYRKFIMGAGLAAAAFAAAPAAAAPVTTAADSRALLLLPLQITKIDDLDFGTVVSASSYGTVSLNAGTGARTFAGGVSGSSAAGRPAYFGGAGSANQQVIVVLVPPAQLSDGNGNTVDVLAMSLDNGNNPIRTVDATTQTFFVGVGGVLGINANQVPGIYSATFQIIANYQ